MKRDSSIDFDRKREFWVGFTKKLEFFQFSGCSEPEFSEILGSGTKNFGNFLKLQLEKKFYGASDRKSFVRVFISEN